MQPTQPPKPTSKTAPPPQTPSNAYVPEPNLKTFARTGWVGSEPPEWRL
jgi:hypothetical protein